MTAKILPALRRGVTKLMTWAFVLPASALAQSPSQETGFVPVSGAPDAAKVDPVPLVVVAYGAIFFLVLAYVVYLARRQAELARRIESASPPTER